ncbi:hypothetical protein PAXRUDRAFT_171897 [Paxillus rubicundulus Ve08.2h10]|uniref:Uncharacterized protein n=1 Tax=Paxillus rubicundulus Ve08.2h10 TaxID=930991 RepID=A0A0D0CX67_9AGAM|nr:hypothetical protein PAXRUDRAFT_171897 [Paxillus rubicundulus Ve08.2h10]
MLQQLAAQEHQQHAAELLCQQKASEAEHIHQADELQHTQQEVVQQHATQKCCDLEQQEWLEDLYQEYGPAFAEKHEEDLQRRRHAVLESLLESLMVNLIMVYLQMNHLILPMSTKIKFKKGVLQLLVILMVILIMVCLSMNHLILPMSTGIKAINSPCHQGIDHIRSQLSVIILV